MHDASNTIIIAAADFEYKPLKDMLDSCSDFASPLFYSFGVGIFDCSANIAKTQAQFMHKDLIYIGTAGTFTEFQGVSLVTAQSVRWLPTSQRHSLSYPVTDKEVISLPPSPKVKLPKKDVICASNVSTDSKLPAALNARDCIENIELYACLRSLDNSYKSFTTVLGLTNHIGADSHKEWKHNFKSAAQMTAEFLYDLLTSQPK